MKMDEMLEQRDTLSWNKPNFDLWMGVFTKGVPFLKVSDLVRL